jgi:signal transduction histidine kinase
VDERVAEALGLQAGIAYEHRQRTDDLGRRVNTLEQELDRTSVRILEEERVRLSRMLHDWMGQMLVGLKLDVHWVAARLPPGAGPEGPAIAGRLDSILTRLDQTIGWVRTVAHELRPPVMETLGLVAAIEWQATDFERRFGIRCGVHAQIDETHLEPRLATAVFLILQEALTNVIQHARATRATVTVRRSDSALRIAVADNGCGISDRAMTNTASLGVIGMRERSALLGGTLTVRRGQPRGTIVTFTVRLAARHHSGRG